jgi:hypothetical protein
MAAMRRSLIHITLFAAIIGLAHHPGAAQQTVYAQDPDGRPITTLADPSTRAVVLFFVASDCPISNRTFPEMQRLRLQFSGENIRFWYVYANATDPPPAILVHQRAFDPGGTPIRDTAGTLARMTGAKVTPEVAILIPSPTSTHAPAHWTPIYTGRIDDRFLRLGLERPRATQHFAERVLTEILTHRPTDKPTGTPIGCAIVGPDWNQSHTTPSGATLP